MTAKQPSREYWMHQKTGIECEENTSHRVKVNSKVTEEDRLRRERRWELEARLEAKRLRELDDLDIYWTEMWQ